MGRSDGYGGTAIGKQWAGRGPTNIKVDPAGAFVAGTAASVAELIDHSDGIAPKIPISLMVSNCARMTA